MFLRDKARTLLLPYVLWSILAAFVTLPLVMIANHIGHRELLENSVFGLLCTPVKFVDRLFGVTKMGPMHHGALWYVRHLIILFCFAPILKLLARRSLAWVAFLIWITLAFLPEVPVVPILSLRVNSLSYFLLGITIAIYLPRDLICLSNRNSIVIPSWVKATFWLYCAHCLILPYLQVVFLMSFGKTDAGIVLTTVTTLVVVVLSTVALGQMIKKRFPRSFNLLTGGRK